MVHPALPLAFGTILDQRYRVQRVIGSGGFGITYECQNVSTQETVAIKELFPVGAQRDKNFVVAQNNEFFEETKIGCRELAKLLVTLRHSGIVRVLGYFEENNTLYLVMSFLQGDTLQHLIEREGAQNTNRVLEWTYGLGAAMEAFHALGLLHLDIKPDNIFWMREGRLVLMDFDLAQKIHAPRDYRTRPLSLTAHCGTPGYAAPEQYSGSGHYSPATDLYALGATLFHALTGASPPPATERTLTQNAGIWPVGTTSTRLHEAISWALELTAAKRPQTIQAFLQALQEPQSVSTSTHVSTQRKRSRPATQVLSTAQHKSVLTTAPAAVPMPIPQPNDLWHEARFLRRDIVWPPLCACCLAPEETSVALKAGKNIWHIPHCKTCAKHVRTAREALPQALWPIIGGFCIAMLGLWKWGLFLGPLGFLVHFSGLSFWALKNGLSDELTTPRCHETKLAATVESCSPQGSHWKFKNPQFLEEVRAANVGYVK